MDARTICRNTIVVLLSAIAPLRAAEIIPETGMYWDLRRNGEGAFIDVQDSKVAMVLFTYDPDGRQAFYTTGGDLQIQPQTEQAIVGLYPQHVYRGDLYQTRGGPIFNANPAPAPDAVKVGRVFLRFSRVSELTLTVTLDAPIPAGLDRDKLYIMARMNFGFGQFGRRVNFAWRPSCWPDLRGEWVFVDRTDPTRPPWRFNFETVEITPPPEQMVCRPPDAEPPQILLYRDPGRGATLRCVYASLQMPDPLDGRGRIGCELRVEGEPVPLLWFHADDAGVKRISASLGGYPNSSMLRTTERVVGWRVE